MRVVKRHMGRTPISRTPLVIRTSGVLLTAPAEERKQKVLRRRFGRFGTLIERVDVRIKDVNGPRGGVDKVARVHVAIAGRPPVFVQERARDADIALARAAASAARTLDRTVGKHGLRAPAPTHVSIRAATRSTTARAGARPATRAARTMRRRRGMVYRLEESATKPSRKSTRKSANRMKGASRLSRRTRRAKHAPRSRAARAQRQRRRAR